jgi:hypothetical protein
MLDEGRVPFALKAVEYASRETAISPNPFNPVTKIRYDIPICHSGVGRGYPLAGHLVKLIIFDALGREVETLMNERQSAGSYEAVWDGTRFASGVYFYRLTAEGFGETKRMILIR